MPLRVKNWRVFQHYKDRSPPWIKLQKSLLDDYDFQCLPIASRALAPMLWLLASESDEGVVDSDPVKLAFRLRWTEKDIRAGLKPLIDKGFLEGASDPLADRKQPATSEAEAEAEAEREAEAETERCVARIFEHWKVCHEHPNARLDDKRNKLIRKALTAYSVDVLCEAIAGYLNSPHHMGQNPRATKYDDIELLLRDSAHVEAGIKFARHPPRTDLSEKTRRNVAAISEWVPPEARSATG